MEKITNISTRTIDVSVAAFVGPLTPIERQQGPKHGARLAGLAQITNQKSESCVRYSWR